MSTDNSDKPSLFRTLWKNKLYIFLGTLLVLLFSLSFISEEVRQQKELSQARTAQLQEDLKEAEKAFQRAVEETGSLENYLKENPRDAALLGYGSLLFLVFLLYGLWINGWCLVRKFQRKPLLVTEEFIETPRWKVSDVFRLMILFLAFSIILGWATEALMAAFPNFLNDNSKLIFHGTFADIIALCLVLYFSQVKYRQPFFAMQIRKETIGKDIWIGISAYLAILPLVVALLLLLVWISSLMQYEPPPQKIVEVLVQEGDQNPILLVYSFILAAFIGPVIEEIFFRGFFYSTFRKKMNAVPAALITGVFFSLLHESAFAFLPIFCLSLLLTYVYEKRKSLVAPIALHIFHNMLFLGYFFIMKENFLDKFLH